MPSRPDRQSRHCSSTTVTLPPSARTRAQCWTGYDREDLFTVVLEHFQTDTADYADYVLPATTQLEHWDILKPYGHLHLALNRPAIEPVERELAQQRDLPAAGRRHGL